jgi:hypothetical protein
MFLFLFVPGFICQAQLVDLGLWSEAELTQIISSAKHQDDPGDTIVELSSHFKDTPYAEYTLIGGPEVPEQLVVNLAAFDCFTFLDIVESLRRTQDFEGFADQLRGVRYSDATVRYEKRKHFFSDWAGEGAAIEDVTTRIGKKRTQLVSKRLNRKSDGSLWLPGIAVTPRQISYIPSNNVDQEVLSELKSGDYVGIYSDLPGLDVSHTGLIVIENGVVLLRHASSRISSRRVIDEDLLEYLKGKPGLVVYRVKP